MIITLSLGTLAFSTVNAVVSILPQKTFLEKIGGDKVDVSVMVKVGNSPHTYEPKPSQMKDISRANIYFSIGVEFEKVWLPKFKNQNKKMKIVDMSQNISKHKKDPHIWTAPQKVKIIAKNILDKLINIDAKNQTYYEANYQNFIATIEQTDKKIQNILNSIPANSKFMVFHPAWGYFAKQYNLIQLPIEIDGKNPKPKELIWLINEAKKQNVKSVFTAPEFSDKIAKQIAKEVGVPVVKISPLNPKWSENLQNLAKAIAGD